MSAGPTACGKVQPAGGAKPGEALAEGVAEGVAVAATVADDSGDAVLMAVADGVGVSSSIGLAVGDPLAVAVQAANTAAITRGLITRVARRGWPAARIPLIPSSTPDRPPGGCRAGAAFTE